MDPTAKGILAATALLSALGGCLIWAVGRLDLQPGPDQTAQGGGQDEDARDPEREADIQARLSRAQALLDEGRLPAAHTALDQLLALEPDQPDALLLRGSAGVNQVLQQDDPALLQAAQADLQRVTELRPKEARAHAYLGLAQGLADAKQGRQELARALELDADCQEAYLARGLLGLRQVQAGDASQAAQAVTDLDRAVQLAPGDARALACRSVLHHALDHGYLAWDDAAAALLAVDGLEARLAPGVTPEELRQILLETVDQLPADSRAGAARALAALLPCRTPETRAVAAMALVRLGPAAAPALPALIAAIGDADEDVRLAVCECLVRLGPAAREAEPALLKALQSHPEESLIQALGAVSTSGEALTALVRLLTNQDEFLRAAAIKALGDMGPPARRAEKPLREALARELRRKSPRQGFALMVALARILPPEEALPDLLRGLEHEDPGVRLGAVQALALLAPQLPRARQAIEEALHDEHELVRQRAGEELERLKGER